MDSTDTASTTKIIIKPDDTSDVVIPLIILIIFVLFFGYMLYLLASSGFQSTTPEDPVNSDNRSSLYLQCPVGQCATNLLSGFKTCPTTNAPLLVDPTQEVCNSAFVCDNPLTPFALQSDGSTNLNGVCEPNTTCACLRTSQCPSYIRSAFTTSGGNPYQSLSGQRITFPQISTYVNNSGQATTNPPIQFNNPATTFCAAPLAWLPLSNPGCNFVNANQSNAMNYYDLVFCMGMSQGCSGVFNNPCLQGTLAVITDNPESITIENINTFQAGCVEGTPCPCDMLTVYDTNFGGVICLNLIES